LVGYHNNLVDCHNCLADCYNNLVDCHNYLAACCNYNLDLAVMVVRIPCLYYFNKIL
jgi:hypothetical protein